jgi:hypothetical protein
MATGGARDRIPKHSGASGTNANWRAKDVAIARDTTNNILYRVILANRQDNSTYDLIVDRYDPATDLRWVEVASLPEPRHGGDGGPFRAGGERRSCYLGA